MEWLLAVLCMIPAAAADLKYRSASLESCVAALLVGSAVFGMWAVSAPMHDILPAATITAVAAGATWAGGRWGGGGDADWWFAAGACAALSTLGLWAPMAAVVGACVSVLLVQTAMCVRRPGLPFPRRLYQHVKRQGDAHRIGIDGEPVPAEESGMVVRPGLPFVTFLAAAAAAAGVVSLL